ncbi:MAG TPA: hypothetical protein VFC31_16150 [Candidatus Limnocylindria bacterium]|nr:hypothetical protein [Candidatus Limnocylindria bacterium]
MPHRIAAFLLALVALFAPAHALVAYADDGPSPAPSVRPPAGVLHHVQADRDVVAPRPAPTHGPRNEVVVLVGGYQSCSCDNTFAALESELTAAGFDYKRFGQDPDFPYDTYGPIGPSAANLRDEIHELSIKYPAVHIVTHSMGGVVADQAFAQGLTGASVATYISWSAPHNGSATARAIGAVSPIANAISGRRDYTRRVLLHMGWESDSDAARDTAVARPVAPPAGVVRVDIREATDAVVPARDATDPGVYSLVFDDAREGHGGALTDPRVLRATIQTIETRAVPPDDRSPQLKKAAARTSWLFDWLVPIMTAAIAIALALWAFPDRLGGGNLLDRVLGPARRRSRW